ncbi:MAG: hypothetical protein H6983_24175 [Ectothiorhodospiraceae bacterium]|nr:hypothetical protein [Chromatiales bacterium]MCP5157297.1 hypothetical protein [Ectothiorhodospiraceae bacterium]
MLARLLALTVVLASAAGLAGCSKDAMQVSSASLTDDATYLWLASVRGEARSVYSTEEDQVALAVRFAHNFVGTYYSYTIEWIAPNGNTYLRAPQRTRFGSHMEMLATLPIRGTGAGRLPGRWTVRLSLEGRLLHEAEFEILTPTMLAARGIDLPAPAPVVLAGAAPEGEVAVPGDSAATSEASSVVASAPVTADEPAAAATGAQTPPLAVAAGEDAATPTATPPSPAAPPALLASSIPSRVALARRAIAERTRLCPPIGQPSGDCVDSLPEENPVDGAWQAAVAAMGGLAAITRAPGAAGSVAVSALAPTPALTAPDTAVGSPSTTPRMAPIRTLGSPPGGALPPPGIPGGAVRVVDLCPPGPGSYACVVQRPEE